MRHNLQRHLGRAVWISVAIAADPGGEFDGCVVDGQLPPQGDATLSVQFAQIRGNGVPEYGFDDGVAARGFLLDGGFDASNFVRAPNGGNDTAQAVQGRGTFEWMNVGPLQISKQL